MAETRARKIPRAPLTDAEKTEIIELYKTDQYSSRDLATQFNSNPSAVLRVLHDANVPVRPQGQSEISIRNQKRNNARRKEAAKQAAELRMAEEIKAARQRDRVNTRADELTNYSDAAASLGEGLLTSMLRQEARASVALDGDTHAVGVPIRDDDYSPEAIARTEEEERKVTSWTPTPEELLAAQEAARRLHEGEGQSTEELVAAYDDQIQSLMNSAEEMAAEHSAELTRAHDYAKAQWQQGVSYGYEQATSHVLALIAKVLTGEIVLPSGGAVDNIVKLLEKGEHWYLAHRDPKPWNNWEANR